MFLPEPELWFLYWTFGVIQFWYFCNFRLEVEANQRWRMDAKIEVEFGSRAVTTEMYVAFLFSVFFLSRLLSRWKAEVRRKWSWKAEVWRATRASRQKQKMEARVSLQPEQDGGGVSRRSERLGGYLHCYGVIISMCWRTCAFSVSDFLFFFIKKTCGIRRNVRFI